MVEKAPDGEKSDVLRESIREYLARLKRDPKPASNEDVDRAMAYTGEAAQWTVNELTRQIVALSQQVAELTNRLASGVIVQGLAGPAPASDTPSLTDEQSAARKAKVIARKW